MAENSPRRPRSEQRQRQVMLAARVNPEEERLIRAAARAQHTSVASLIRKAVLAAVEHSPPSGDQAAILAALAGKEAPGA